MPVPVVHHQQVHRLNQQLHAAMPLGPADDPEQAASVINKLFVQHAHRAEYHVGFHLPRNTHQTQEKAMQARLMLRLKQKEWEQQQKMQMALLTTTAPTLHIPTAAELSTISHTTPKGKELSLLRPRPRPRLRTTKVRLRAEGSDKDGDE